MVQVKLGWVDHIHGKLLNAFMYTSLINWIMFFFCFSIIDMFEQIALFQIEVGTKGT